VAELYCKHITSVKRFLPAGSNLLLGDQITGGSAIKTGTGDSSTQTDAELLKDQVASDIYGLDSSMIDLFNKNSVLGPGDFITEGGFEAGPDGADVIHSGYGGEARSFAPGTNLKEGDLVVNGRIVGPNGEQLNAPLSIDGDGYSVGPDGAVVSPGGATDDEAYCSLQELAGKPAGSSFLDDLFADIDLDLEIPGLDFSWWVKVQEKINELSALQAKFLAKTQNLVSLVELDPEKVCQYVPDVSALIALLQKVQQTIRKIEKIFKQISKILKKIKKAIKFIKWLFAPIRLVEAFLFLLQIVNGLVDMLEQAAKNLTDTSKLIPQLIALLQKLLAQCMAQRGAEAGLSQEQCEAVGGVYVDRRLGDLGDAGSGGQLGGDLGLGDLNLGLEDDDDKDLAYMKPGTDLNAGDYITDGSAVGPDGSIYEAPFTIPDTGDGSGDGSGDGNGFQTGANGATGESDNAIMSEEELNALIDSQILDLSQCMTALDDISKTRSFG